MKIKDDVLIALLAGILVISKEILAFLPNVEIVSFLLIIYTCCLNFKRAILIALVFSLLEILLYGLGMWTIMWHNGHAVHQPPPPDAPDFHLVL